jgi:hypothetical protein
MRKIIQGQNIINLRKMFQEKLLLPPCHGVMIKVVPIGAAHVMSELG